MPNQLDLVLARLAAFPDPPSWVDGFAEKYRQSHEVVMTDLGTDMIGLHCAAGGTPIPAGA